MTEKMPRRPSPKSPLGEERNGKFRRVTKMFLRSVTSDPLGSITLLDLSSCGLKRITGLAACPNIEIVIARDNEIDTLVDLSGCPQLWKLDVSCNELRDLCGFEKFTTFGTLIASCNQLSWMELAKIAHIEILNLFLSGNVSLERDHNYRKHVVKCLPKTWSLDGELISSYERQTVNSFFHKTANSKRPVRLKLPRHNFVPSFRKQGCDSTIYGKRTADFCKYFGKNEVHNQTLDDRRLQYLCKNFNTDFVLESCNEPTYDFLTACLSMREQSMEKWNMFVLLLISSLVFSIPKSLMFSALHVVGMSDAEMTTCDAILKLPCQQRTNVTSLLFSFIKLYGLGAGITAPLYDTIRSLSNRLVKVAYGDTDVEIDMLHQHVLAAELVQMFCLVPHLSSYLDDESVVRILVSATLNNNFECEARQLFRNFDAHQAKENLVEFITLQIQEAKTTSYYSNDDCYNKTRGESSAGFTAAQPNAKASSRRPSTAPPNFARHGYKNAPSIGDAVLLGPQRLGHIISKPDIKVVLVQVDSLSSSRYLQADYKELFNNKQSLFYVRKDDLGWDERFQSWKLHSSSQPTTATSEFEKPIISPRKLGLRNQALCREASQITRRSKATFTVSEEEIIAINGFGSSEDVSKSKAAVKLSPHGEPPQREHNEEEDKDNQHLKTNSDERDVIKVGLNQELEDRYLPVFQSNSYQLYYTDKARYSMPTAIKSSVLPKSLNLRGPTNNFIRKSNWMVL